MSGFEQLAIDVTGVRSDLSQVLETGESQALVDFWLQHGDVKLLIDDPTGHYPERTHFGRELISHGGQRFVDRVYFQNGSHDDQRPPRQFRLRSDNIGAIAILSDEA